MYFAQVAKIGFFLIKSNKIFRQSEVTSDDEVAIIIIILPPLLIYDFIFLNLKATQHFWPMQLKLVEASYLLEYGKGNVAFSLKEEDVYLSESFFGKNRSLFLNR